MANLNDTNDILDFEVLDLKTARQAITFWHLRLRSNSDTFTVPRLEDTNSAGSLTDQITVSAAAESGGQNVITVTGGSDGQKVIVATAHLKNRLNNNSFVDPS